METGELKMTNKEKIMTILKSTNREGMEELLAWMDKNGFYNAPCSSKYHFCKPGGLAEHSLNVLQIAIEYATTSFDVIKESVTHEFIDSVVICSLLHDLGKAGQFGKPNYIENPEPQDGAYKTNKDLLFIPHEVRSIAIASKFIDLTEEEQFAILYHNGLYGELKGFKGNETPLYMVLHFADMWASRVMEKEE